MNRLAFYLSARLFGEACLELYICRRTPDKREQVYLIPRPRNDPFYAGLLHLPGVRKIPTETDHDHLRRAFAETPFLLSVSHVEYIACSTFRAPRGTVYSDIRRVVVPYWPEGRDFYDIDHLPANMIEYQREIIQKARRYV